MQKINGRLTYFFRIRATENLIIDQSFFLLGGCDGILGLNLVVRKEVRTIETGAIDVVVELLFVFFLLFRSFEVTLFLRLDHRFRL